MVLATTAQTTSANLAVMLWVADQLAFIALIYCFFRFNGIDFFEVKWSVCFWAASKASWLFASISTVLVGRLSFLLQILFMNLQLMLSRSLMNWVSSISMSGSTSSRSSLRLFVRFWCGSVDWILFLFLRGVALLSNAVEGHSSCSFWWLNASSVAKSMMFFFRWIWSYLGQHLLSAERFLRGFFLFVSYLLRMLLSCLNLMAGRCFLVAVSWFTLVILFFVFFIFQWKAFGL